MNLCRYKQRVICVLALGLLLSSTALAQHEGHRPAQGQEPQTQRPRREVIPAGPVMTLEALEAMAVQRNPM